MRVNGFSKFMVRVKGYVKENWGSTFIIGFIVFLLSAAVFPSLGFSYSADAIVVYSYYALVAGVILQLACFLKHQKKSVRLEAV